MRAAARPCSGQALWAVLLCAVSVWAWAWLTPASARAAPEGGAALMRRFECHRCHDGTGLAAVPRDRHCVRCHQEIQAGTYPAPPADLRRWQGHLRNLLLVPSLTGVGGRLRRDWLAGFLLRPHDLRPGLPATMPRLPLSAAEAEAIAAHLVPAESAAPAPGPARADAGRRWLDTLGCGTCHRFTGAPPLRPSAIPVPLSPPALAAAMALAPDLRHARARFQPGALVAWLKDPRAQKPDTAMPAIPLHAAQAEEIAAYLLHAPLSPPAPAPVPARLPLLSRRVGFDEVNERVFHRTCRHCHAAPDYAQGDGGPGNTGGLGFRGRGLSLASYEDIAAGSKDDAGRRRSIFAPISGGDGTPRLLAHLLARQIEVAGGEIPGVRGMPLGLPPLSMEDIQLVASWIAQGRPR